MVRRGASYRLYSPGLWSQANPSGGSGFDRPAHQPRHSAGQLVPFFSGTYGHPAARGGHARAHNDRKAGELPAALAQTGQRDNTMVGFMDGEQ